jgi:hypothetical protein
MKSKQKLVTKAVVFMAVTVEDLHEETSKECTFCSTEQNLLIPSSTAHASPAEKG